MEGLFKNFPPTINPDPKAKKINKITIILDFIHKPSTFTNWEKFDRIYLITINNIIF